MYRIIFIYDDFKEQCIMYFISITRALFICISFSDKMGASYERLRYIVTSPIPRTVPEF